MVKRTRRICEVCGTAINPYAIYCSECGLRLIENKEKPTFENYVAAGFNSTREKKIYACNLVKLPILTRSIVERWIWKGDIEIEFCSCPTCQKVYREFLAEKNIVLLDGPRDPHCKEIVNQVYNGDIKGLRINVENYFLHQVVPKYFPNGFDD